MTKLELEAQANSILAAAKATIELQGDFPVTILIHATKGWARLPFPEEAGQLLNNGSAKDVIFGKIREIVQDLAADGCIFATDTWIGQITPEGQKHYESGEWNAAVDAGFVTLTARGWATQSQGITVAAQSSTDVLLIEQKYQRLASGLVQLLTGKRRWMDQSQFSGRQKMFGDLRWENLGSEAATKAGPRKATL